MIQRVYYDLFVYRTGKQIYPFNNGTGNEICLMLVGNVISVSGHGKVDGLPNLEIHFK